MFEDKPIPEVIMSHDVYNNFIDEPLVEVIDSSKIKVKMMYPLLGMKNGFDRCFLRKTVKEMLEKAASSLPKGYQFLIWDTWRPFSLQKELFTSYSKDIIQMFHLENMKEPELTEFISQYVADPIPNREFPPAHTTGSAIDLTILKDGKELDFGTDFDSFSDKTNTVWYEQHPSDDKEILENRRFLYWTMINAGFTNIPSEWWHYEYGDQNYSKVTGKDALYKGIFEKEEFL